MVQQMDIKISVIMAVYNEPINQLKECIDSVLNQSYKDFEFIITIDNINNKEIISLLEQYSIKNSNIILIYNEKNI